MSRLLRLLATTIAIASGLLVLMGLLLGAEGGVVAIVTNALLQFLVIAVSLTLLIGVINLLVVHLRRLVRRDRGWVYSIVLLISFGLVMVLWLTGANNENMVLLETVQVSVESALAGILVFALVYGAYRMMHKTVTWSGTLFTLVVVISLVGALPIQEIEFVRQVRDWMLAVPVSAGARGILLGIALATLVAGVRVLVGQERAYRE